jgi:hypothetical protein
MSSKQTTVLLVVIAALLAAIIGILVWQNNNSSTPQASSQAATTDPAAAGAAASGDAAAGGTATGVQPAGGEEFDPATAPVVPADQTPEQYVNEYYELSQEGEFDTAYQMLPTATQAYYGDSSGFASTLQGYGITGFTVEPQGEAEGKITVVGVQDAQGMQFAYTWTFVQGEDGTWLVESREMAGM